MINSNFIFKWNPTISFPKNYPSHANKMRTLFKAWNNVLEEYELAWREVKNLPYVYNEQAEVGLLAVAARDTRGLPFLEFSIRKQGQEKNYGGRADLEIYWRKILDWNLGIEAKAINISCSLRRRDKDLIQTLKAPLTEAHISVKKLRKSYFDYLALVIGRLVNASDDFSRKQLLAVLFKAAWQVKADFCAIHFCDDDIWKSSEFNDCPGIVIIGKMSGKRASRKGVLAPLP